MSDDLKCKICGGQLEIFDFEHGVVKCRNCSSKTLLDTKLLSELNQVQKPQIPQELMVNMTKEDVSAAKQARIRQNVVYSIKGAIALISLAILAIYAFIMYSIFKGNLQASNLEMIIISLIGLITPAMFGSFSSVTKSKTESLILNIMFLLITLVISAVVVYFAAIRYLTLVL